MSSVQIKNDRGRMWDITADGRTMQMAIGRNFDLGNSMEKGWSFTANYTQTPTAAAERVFLKIANLSSDPLVITGVSIVDAVAEIIRLYVAPNWAQGAGTALVPVNRAFGSPNLFTAKGSCFRGVAITGIDGQLEVHRMTVALGVDARLNLNNAPIVLGPNMAFALASVTSGAEITASVDMYYAMVPRVNG